MWLIQCKLLNGPHWSDSTPDVAFFHLFSVFHPFNLFVESFFFTPYILLKILDLFNWGIIIYSYCFFPNILIKFLCISLYYHTLTEVLFLFSYLLNLYAFSCIFCLTVSAFFITHFFFKVLHAFLLSLKTFIPISNSVKINDSPWICFISLFSSST